MLAGSGKSDGLRSWDLTAASNVIQMGDRVDARYIGRCGETDLDAQINLFTQKPAANEAPGRLC
jgi:hypothetical protein